MPRNTSTGKVLEDIILPPLNQGTYKVQRQAYIGERLGGKKHQIDCMASKNNKKFFISLKWQQSGGTAEQKVTHEVICLAKAIREHKKKGEDVKAYLILGGPEAKGNRGGSKSWTLRDFYINGGLNSYLHPDYANLVEIIKTEEFIALANNGKL